MNLQTADWKQILISYLIGMLASYIFTSYFSNFYPQTYQFIFLTLIFQLTCGALAFLFLRTVLESVKTHWHENQVSLLTLGAALSLAITAVVIAWQFPGLFDRRIISMNTNRLPEFFILVGISSLGAIPIVTIMERKNYFRQLKSTSLFHFISTNINGLFLSLFFFFAYFIFTQTINFPAHYTTDLYFETDISAWITRLTSGLQDNMPVIRAVHPAVMLFLRPLIWLIAIFLNGNKLQAVFILSAAAGASCVFLTWVNIKRTLNTTYATIVASILGASASQLLLSSMLETYIFSALALNILVLLLQTNRLSLKSITPIGILIFGITVTNLGQACILYFLKRPQIKTILKFVMAVMVITLLLNIVQVFLFPRAKPLYIPSYLLREQKYEFNLFESPQAFWGRVNLISHAILLYGIVSPKPFVLTDELGTKVPNFRTFQITAGEIHVAGYKGFNDITAKLWVVIVVLAFSLFAINFLKSPRQMRFPLSLLLCLGFNFVLHCVYGDDPMLYSPDWVYALVLFVAISLKQWADNKFLQIGLLAFLGMAIYTNLGLIYQIMAISLPYYGN